MTSLGLDWVRNHSRCIFGCGCHRLVCVYDRTLDYRTTLELRGAVVPVSLLGGMMGQFLGVRKSHWPCHCGLVERLILFFTFPSKPEGKAHCSSMIWYTQRKGREIRERGNGGAVPAPFFFPSFFYPSLCARPDFRTAKWIRRRSEVNRLCLCEFAQILTASYCETKIKYIKKQKTEKKKNNMMMCPNIRKKISPALFSKISSSSSQCIARQLRFPRFPTLFLVRFNLIHLHLWSASANLYSLKGSVPVSKRRGMKTLHTKSCQDHCFWWENVPLLRRRKLSGH